MNNWIEISEDSLASNFHALQAAAGPATEILAVVKANAYGHGAELCARILVQAGARWLGVTCASEGARVRAALLAASLHADILVMSGSLPPDVPLLVAHDLTPVVWTPDQLASLAGTALRIHLEVDTGMGRQGVQPGPALDQLLTAIARSGLPLDGLLTHFCSSEVAASELTSLQQKRFEQAGCQVLSHHLTPRWVHAGNTSTIDNPANPPNWLTSLAGWFGASPMVRSGLALYGYCLPIEGDASPHLRATLKPVLTWQAATLAVRSLAPGDTVGYNATFTATQPMRVALLPVGYADGLRRELSYPHGWVICNGQRCPILGRISMNLTVVDVTSVPGVEQGAPATILGEGITAEDHARLAHTIPYEILCAIHPCG